MSKMKMSERFPEAFQVDGNPSFGVQNCVWTTFSEDEQSTADQDSAIEHAVLNHDRMMEEIKELRDFVRMVADADSASDEVKSFMVHSFVHNAKQLLAKLN